jgi:hypothetical protein
MLPELQHSHLLKKSTLEERGIENKKRKKTSTPDEGRQIVNETQSSQEGNAAGELLRVVQSLPTELSKRMWTFVKSEKGYSVHSVAMELLNNLEYPAYIVKDRNEESGAVFYTTIAPDIDDLMATRSGVRAVSKSSSQQVSIACLSFQVEGGSVRSCSSP